MRNIVCFHVLRLINKLDPLHTHIHAHTSIQFDLVLSCLECDKFRAYDFIPFIIGHAPLPVTHALLPFHLIFIRIRRRTVSFSFSFSFSFPFCFWLLPARSSVKHRTHTHHTYTLHTHTHTLYTHSSGDALSAFRARRQKAFENK